MQVSFVRAATHYGYPLSPGRGAERPFLAVRFPRFDESR